MLNHEEVEVNLVCQGSTLLKYAHAGQNYFQAPIKGEYIIRLRNKTAARKLVVISVDGRNILDGEEASYDGQGYVLNPWQTADIKGWRRTDQEVAAFEFVEQAESYDVKVGGTGSNVGVIGIAVFDEKPIYQYWQKNIIPVYPQYDQIMWNSADHSTTTKSLYSNDVRSCCDGLESAPMGGSADFNSSEAIYASPCSAVVEPSKTVGTGYGSKTEMKTTTVEFNRKSSPSQIVTFRYATEVTLKKWGVIKEPTAPAPNAFPAQKVAVKAPPGWRG